MDKLTYKDAGVDTLLADSLVEEIKVITKHNRFNPLVVNDIGSFGAMFKMPQGFKEPILVSSTDGVGNKLRLAFTCGKHDTIGIDLVAMSINDILVSGATPLFFLDYFACSSLKDLQSDTIKTVIKSIDGACQECSCALIGGETAEMPNMYHAGEYDLAGFAVGVVEKDKIVSKINVKEDDILLGIHSSGLHSNGYSLVLELIKREKIDLHSRFFNSDLKWAEVLLTPTLIYSKAVLTVLESTKDNTIHAMAHITGGGITDNLPRSLPDGLGAVIELNKIPSQPIFDWIKDKAKLTDTEMLKTFNCGVGYILILDSKDVEFVMSILKKFHLSSTVIGKIIKHDSLLNNNIVTYE